MGIDIKLLPVGNARGDINLTIVAEAWLVSSGRRQLFRHEDIVHISRCGCTAFVSNKRLSIQMIDEAEKQIQKLLANIRATFESEKMTVLSYDAQEYPSRLEELHDIDFAIWSILSHDELEDWEIKGKLPKECKE